MLNSYKYQYEKLSIQVPKERLNNIINDLFGLNYSIFWGFDRGRMILNIYYQDENNKLTFIRHKKFLELIQIKVVNKNVLNILDNSIQLLNIIKNKEKQELETSNHKKYNEIDYYLMELHESIQLGDTQKINKTKAILQKLVSSIE